MKLLQIIPFYLQYLMGFLNNTQKQKYLEEILNNNNLLSIFRETNFEQTLKRKFLKELRSLSSKLKTLRESNDYLPKDKYRILNFLYLIFICFIFLLIQNPNFVFCDELIETSTNHIENNIQTNSNQTILGLTLFIGVAIFVIYVLNSGGNTPNFDTLTPIIQHGTETYTSINTTNWDSELMEKGAKKLAVIGEPVGFSDSFVFSLYDQLTVLKSKIDGLEIEITEYQRANRVLSSSLLEQHKQISELSSTFDAIQAKHVNLQLRYNQVLETKEAVNTRKLIEYIHSLQQSYSIPSEDFTNFMRNRK